MRRIHAHEHHSTTIAIHMIARILLFLPLTTCSAQQVLNPSVFNTRQLKISVGCTRGSLWKIGTPGGQELSFAPPSFQIDGRPMIANANVFRKVGASIHLSNGATKRTFESPVASYPHLWIQIEFEVNDETPIIRFRYVLRSDRALRLTKSGSHDDFAYFSTSLRAMPKVEQVTLSSFAELIHSYVPSEESILSSRFVDEAAIMGPIIVASNDRQSVLIAYEHGSQFPDAFLLFHLKSDRVVSLQAEKGNYVSAQLIDSTHPFQTIWMEAAVSKGNIGQLASAYRTFVLKYLTQNSGTRKPYIFYNTWNFQERNKWWNGKQYLDSMNQARILREIDIAHEMGIEVFVLDAGWFEKTGDWAVSTSRFPNGLRDVKHKLNSYGMQLGLWFGPTSAAISSSVVREHPEWRMSLNGKIDDPHEIWETEKSYSMCMVSGYADTFADELIRLAKELGVTYFKWDAIAQYGCNDPHHEHGGNSVTGLEREQSYGFQLIQRMTYVADKVAVAVPGAIVDFDVTEGGRAMGLGFLSAGKFFLINNGPYYWNYDIPHPNANPNVFSYPGEARAWIARSPLTFDKWIPSVLFLTHYFPDDPRASQEVNLASLILGQNGIWGDLFNVSDSGTRYIGDTLRLYKQVRDDITSSDPVVSGVVSGSPEIHEKISAANGRGAVVVFATAPGKYVYSTSHRVSDHHRSVGEVVVTIEAGGNARIEATFDHPGATIVFFGAD